MFFGTMMNLIPIIVYLKKKNVIRQYKSIEYPYLCDFYIPDINSSEKHSDL